MPLKDTQRQVVGRSSTKKLFQDVESNIPQQPKTFLKVKIVISLIHFVPDWIKLALEVTLDLKFLHNEQPQFICPALGLVWSQLLLAFFQIQNQI